MPVPQDLLIVEPDPDPAHAARRLARRLTALGHPATFMAVLHERTGSALVHVVGDLGDEVVLVHPHAHDLAPAAAQHRRRRLHAPVLLRLAWVAPLPNELAATFDPARTRSERTSRGAALAC